MRKMLVCAAVAAIAFTARAHGQGRPRIILFQEDNYRGARLELDARASDLRRMRFNDRVSSIRVLSGTWELCAAEGFRGKCITVDRDIPRLNRAGFDDRLSSLRPVSRRDGRDNRRDDRTDRR